MAAAEQSAVPTKKAAKNLALIRNALTTAICMKFPETNVGGTDVCMTK